MTLYIAAMFFLFGTILGSFYNVVGYRLPKGESLIYPSSHCTSCNHKLGPLELIPIISYIFLGGKCKNCKQKVSLFYPIFEFLAGLLFAVAFLIFGFSYELIIALIFISLTLIIIISDYFYLIIPDEVLIASIILIAIAMIYFKGWGFLWSSILNGILAFVIMYLIKTLGDILFKKESMGGGDIKLMFIFGMILTWPMAVISIFMASFIALPISIIILYVKKDHVVPFGPFLCIAALILILTKIDFQSIINIITPY